MTAPLPATLDDSNGSLPGSGSLRDLTIHDWRRVVAGVVREVIDDRIVMVAAAVAFFAMLGFFPATVAAIAAYGLVFDPAAVQDQLTALATYLPYMAARLVGEQLHRLVATPSTELGSGLLIGLAGAFWSASSASAALIEAVCIAYDEEERLGFVTLRLQAFRFTAAAFAGGALLLASLIGIRAWLGDHPLATCLRWLLLGGCSILALAALYRRGPRRRAPRWRWVTAGAVLATALWLGASALLALYVGRVGDYEATYGAIGGAIVLMLWLFTTAFATLLGAELNAVLERRLKRRRRDAAS